MSHPVSLTADTLYRKCDPATLDFTTTADLAPLDEIIGQDRAMAALHFGVGMRHDTYHLFALGPGGVGMHDIVRRALEERAAGEPVPDDWCYAHNFSEPHKPRAIRLPAGRGRKFRQAVQNMIEELRSAIPAAFESEDFRIRRRAIEEAAKKRQEDVFNALNDEALKRHIALLRMPAGMMFAPVKDEEVLSPEEFRKLPEPEQERIRADIEDLQQKLENALREVPQWEREVRKQLRHLARETTSRAVQEIIDELSGDYGDLPQVKEHLEEVKRDVIDTADQFLAGVLTGSDAPDEGIPSHSDPGRFRRYRINLVVDNGDRQGAPVLYEDHPAFQHLVGRIEHISQQGALVTDFNLIKAGALHRANEGYLILDARRVLMQPFAWEELKRVLRAREIRIETLSQTLSLISTVTLEPEAIPLNVKVVLVGDRMLYYMLCAYDPDFGELFKVPVDFGDDLERTPDAAGKFARLLATMAARNGLRPLDREAVARVIEHASRLVDDTTRLSVHERPIGDLLREADFFAARNDHKTITREDVAEALKAQVHRADRARERIYSEIRRGVLMIDTAGARIGQINGLVVSTLGNFAFGRPSRITATVRLGRGEVVDIEQRVEFGGPIHAKGVLILEGFLGARFASDRPLTLRASLVFEQSYGPVEGDSASVAELCALLSALSGVPILQSLAVTGSVNQHGRVQAIGGVNEKIEGFFDICRNAGLTGDQGVIIPATNVAHLMLRADVVEAVAAGQFHVYAVETVDEALHVLTGMEPGTCDSSGQFPEGSVNHRVAARLVAMSEAARHFASRGDRERENE